MKKLFISVPMNGRTEENIRTSMTKMHRVAESVFDQTLEVIPSYIEHEPPVDAKQNVWFLGESIKKLAEADYFIGIWPYYDRFKGCFIEREIAEQYGIESVLLRTENIKHLMPDVYRDMEHTAMPI